MKPRVARASASTLQREHLHARLAHMCGSFRTRHPKDLHHDSLAYMSSRSFPFAILLVFVLGLAFDDLRAALLSFYFYVLTLQPVKAAASRSQPVTRAIQGLRQCHEKFRLI